MLKEMLKLENVQIKEQVENWQAAIHTSLEALVSGGYVTPGYIDQIIESTYHYGPYYIIAKDVAFIHGRPEAGVLKKQLAVTLLRNPVSFSEDSEPVRLLIALAATDSESHMDVMKTLATIFMDETRVTEIVNAKTEEEIYQMFLKAEKETEE